jgi:hypothetical protein
MPVSLANVLKRLKREWSRLAAFATSFALIVGAFLLPLPVGASQFGSGGRITRLAVVVTAVVTGLVAVPLVRWSAKRHTWGWWKTAAISLIISVISFFAYEWLVTTWTCTYDSHRVVIGSDFTPHGKQFLERHPEWITCEDWIMAHAGKVEEIWTRRSIDIRCIVLASFYLAAWPLFAIAIICAVQAVYCNSRRAR